MGNPSTGGAARPGLHLLRSPRAVCRSPFELQVAPKPYRFVPALLGLAAFACGRPATIADCDEIVAKIAELELRGAKTADPSFIAKEVADTKQAFQAKAKQECVGKRITDGALRCVRNAKTAEEVVRECLN
jgi:hypothetical protein